MEHHELAGTAIYQFRSQRVGTGVHHPEAFRKIQRNFIGLLIAAQQSYDYRLRLPSTSLGQVGEDRTLLRHKFDWNLEVRILHRHFT